MRAPEKLADYRVVVFPGGMASTSAKTLTSTGRAAVRKFVADGGGYLGVSVFFTL